MFQEDHLGDTNELFLTFPEVGSLHSEDFGELPAPRRVEVCLSDLNCLLCLSGQLWWGGYDLKLKVLGGEAQRARSLFRVHWEPWVSRSWIWAPLPHRSKQITCKFLKERGLLKFLEKSRDCYTKNPQPGAAANTLTRTWRNQLRQIVSNGTSKSKWAQLGTK